MAEDRHTSPGRPAGAAEPIAGADAPKTIGAGPAASPTAQRANAHEAAEERILREGEAARLALARRTARQALREPSILDARRLSRLGPDGLERFVAELRVLTLGAGTPPVRPPSPAARAAAPSPMAETACPAPEDRPAFAACPAPTARLATAARPVAPAVRRADFAGWWRSERTGRAGFEARGRRWGLLAGLVSILAGFTWLALTRH